LQKFQLKIVGDPDYLMPTYSIQDIQTAKNFYGPDFTIDPSQGQVFIEIDFNQVEDYDSESGLLKPNNDIFYMNYPSDLKIKGIVYQISEVVSTFSKGKFEQTIEGTLYYFPIPSGKNTAAAAANPVATQASVRAVDNDIAAGRTNTAPSTDNTAADSANGFTADQLRAKSTAARLSGTLLVPSSASAVTNATLASGSSLPAPNISNLPPAKAVTSNGQTVGTASGGLLFNVFSASAPKKIADSQIGTGVQPGSHEY
jgi:hypothetical protein